MFGVAKKGEKNLRWKKDSMLRVELADTDGKSNVPGQINFIGNLKYYSFIYFSIIL